MLKFTGSECFRQRLVCSTLTGRPIRIDQIRSKDEDPGLRDFEACLLRLTEKISDGCVVQINQTGTCLRYRPGFVLGGSNLVHNCGTSRSIGYFLEPLVLLAIFGKKPLSITLQGITNDDTDQGIDTWRTVTLPLIRKLCGIEDGLELQIVKRGARPGGGGEVRLRVPVVREVPSIKWTDEGMVKRIRGVAYSTKVSPQNTNRMVDGARGILNRLLADVYIFTDAVSGKQSGNSPGYGINLVAETTSGCYVSSEACASYRQGQGKGPSALQGQVAEEVLVVPEDIGKHAAAALLEEVHRGGVVDGCHQALLILLCALGPELINEVRLGPLTPYAVQMLRHVKDFFGITFSIRPENDHGTIFMSCVGVGVKNLGRRAT
ncbi:unnamed protein product [Ostreobium quekettii]|uniref:RNA 3'-terminal phosphate cyclase-like protein n=1 Tax=Ostreobium quekettii TaxID=121088 RepID=A0A8S1JI82_9CHLO|nr:unnamed protein product [Ostreobium quekettii]|eukprot:evm.model.scf_792.3 EVM.evm.TU.scf_792.3   scf_792:19589-23767(+)